MCGIFALLNAESKSDDITREFKKGKSRGPESSVLVTKHNQPILGFHRLAINGINEESNQPLVIDDVILICNGEIYNYKELYQSMGVQPTTGSDCEVIIHLYIKYGIEQTLKMLDGVFAFVLHDNRGSTNYVYVARDPYGVRPLYWLKPNSNIVSSYNLYGFTSELKCLEHFYNDGINLSIMQFTPGTYNVFAYLVEAECWKLQKENIPYFLPSFSHTWLFNDIFEENALLQNAYLKISDYLVDAVNKRCLTTERPIACLLSGGLDSSLIAALVNNFYNLNNFENKLETYSIGLQGSEDLKYARIVADYLKTNHTEIIVTEQKMFESIPEVIQAIESYDTTSVRASIGNYLLGKFISKNSNAKVIFNGDGSDELLGGYLYMNKCPDDIEFDNETRRLLKDIHLFDVLRSDKSISSHGLEPRTPFLDRSFVNYVLSIPPNFRNHNHHHDEEVNGHIEKSILRNSFTEKKFRDCYGRQILPNEILWRKKEAFSDGVSSHGRSLYKILQERIANKLNREDSSENVEANIDTEKMYYKQIFNDYYPNCEHIVPYYWMPNYTNATDPSARTLDIYNTTEELTTV
jgi:asparagine synthase (glutamine-hydrolysing)